MLKTSPVADVIEDFRSGKFVIICDSADRENEGDLAIATESITPDQIAFMLNEARGLICVSISREQADKLRLPPQVGNNTSRFNTPFAVSVDLKRLTSIGQTAEARAETLRRLASPDSSHSEFVSPGSNFPLVAHPQGVFGREGQTEGSYDLARLSGRAPSGVICEILKPDGSLARAPELNEFAMKHGIKITTIDDLISYRLQNESLVRQSATSALDTDWGPWKVSVFESEGDGKEHLALIYEAKTDPARVPIVRLHSECLTGDVFGSRRCDCGGQLKRAMEAIVANGSGVLLYLRQEGRGIGLGNKLKAYQLQDLGRDTVEANLELGFAADERDFAVGAQILKLLNYPRIKLLTNNPDKLEALSRLGIEVVERVPLLAEEDELTKSYLNTKRDKLGHLL